MFKKLFTNLFKVRISQSDINIPNSGVISYFDENIKNIDYQLYGLDKYEEINTEKILAIIRYGLVQGSSYKEIRNIIYKEVGGLLTKEIATRIAIHLLGLSYGGSNHESGRILSIEYSLVKEWASSKDEKVCELCTKNELMGPIPFEEPFLSGDMFAPRKNEISCRCTSTYRIIGIK